MPVFDVLSSKQILELIDELTTELLDRDHVEFMSVKIRLKKVL